ncbi:CLH1-like protein [Mya arenaria]|uniref:CLH1-like protein n=1 Tax=Mya arenaria TaxID=6604 RepID=A0ABY7E1C6_MYAAR|nr:CLH1-like protein [Mya arenaria]
MIPIAVPAPATEIGELTNVGIPADQVTWSRVTITSDRWIAVTVFNLKDGSISYAGQTSADSVLMNPSEPVIALKAEQRFEVFNVETKLLLTKTKVHDPVHFWTWLTPEILAIITDTTVYHWHLFKTKDSQPEKVFCRHSRLAFSEITSYKADVNLRWFAITGLTPEEDKISGLTQLYNMDEDITQCIACHAVCFDTYKFAGNNSRSTVFCVGSRDIHNHGKVHVIELGPYKQGNFALRNTYDHIHFEPDEEHYDFPVALHVSKEFGLVFLLTKYGYLYLCDMETSTCLCSTKVAEDIIFTSTLNTETQGIIGVTRSGQVLAVDIKKDTLIDYVRDTAKKGNQADRLERAIITINEPGTSRKLP